MAPRHDKPCSHGSDRGRAGTLGLGVAAGIATAAGLLFGRKVAVTAKVGKGHPLKHRALDMAAGAMQPKYPLTAMSTYLNGFHMYADDMGRQVEASHFCIHLQHDLHQCVIFDRNAADARLIGIEYIISEERFQALPAEEKQLWHSHHYEVKSGILVAPGIPDMAEHAYFEDLVTTYGKTFHTWQYDRDDFPYGVPQLMMGLTEDGQADEAGDPRARSQARHLDTAQAREPGRHPDAGGRRGGQLLGERPNRADAAGRDGLQAVDRSSVERERRMSSAPLRPPR